MNQQTNHVPPETVVIHSWSDLRVFGINVLTGEACAYGQRLLCDVNEQGKALLAEFFGMPNIQLAPPMNSRVNEQPSVGSVMLERSAWRALAHFGHFHQGALAYAEIPSEIPNGPIVGIYSENRLQEYERASTGDASTFRLVRNFRSSQPRVGSRNVHAMSGRVY